MIESRNGTDRRGGPGSYGRGALPLYGDQGGPSRGSGRISWWPAARSAGIRRRPEEHRIAKMRNRIELFEFFSLNFPQEKQTHEW